MQVKTTASRIRATAFRATLSITAATALLFTAATASEAKSRKNWRNANAAIHTSGSFSGIASYYGPGFAGRKTASGTRFNPMGMTTAHRSLPFGTRLRVSHGSRSVVVTVTDRGPFIRGRVLDLSQGAARALGMGGTGRVTAQIEGRGGSRTFADASAD